MAMADQGAPPLPKLPGHPQHHAKPAASAPNQTRRRVSFSDRPITIGKARARRGCSYCCRCCAWTSIIIVFLLLITALAATLLFMWLQPTAPEFHVERLSIPKMNLTEDSGQMYLTTELDLLVQVTNKNDKVGFKYGRTVVSLVSNFVSLGRANVPNLTLGPRNTSVMRVRPGVSNFMVDNATGKRLKMGFERKDLVLDIRVGCMMSVVVGNQWSDDVPIMVRCDNVQWAQVSNGFKPRCKVHLFG